MVRRVGRVGPQETDGPQVGPFLIQDKMGEFKPGQNGRVWVGLQILARFAMFVHFCSL